MTTADLRTKLAIAKAARIDAEQRLTGTLGRIAEAKATLARIVLLDALQGRIDAINASTKKIERGLAREDRRADRTY